MLFGAAGRRLEVPTTYVGAMPRAIGIHGASSFICFHAPQSYYQRCDPPEWRRLDFAAPARILPPERHFRYLESARPPDLAGRIHETTDPVRPGTGARLGAVGRHDGR